MQPDISIVYGQATLSFVLGARIFGYLPWVRRGKGEETARALEVGGGAQWRGHRNLVGSWAGFLAVKIKSLPLALLRLVGDVLLGLPHVFYFHASSDKAGRKPFGKKGRVEEEEEVVDEGSILKPCVYKLR